METFKDIIAERRTYTAKRRTHSHLHAQLIIPLQGELSIQAGAQDLMLDAQTLFFVPSECEHTYHSAVRNEVLVLDIPHFMISSSQLQHRGVSYSLNNQWKGIRYLILNELDRQSPEPALKELFPYISHCLLQEQLPRSIRYIHEHYAEDLTVQKLAELEHYNRSYYTDWFIKFTGKSPSAYVQEVRLNKAKELLRHTDLPILHIAMQVGLEHQSSLTRLFQKCEQLTPSQYRKKGLL
ncbi:AraC family transcriptional regulator [Paenibacillus filicis]|uniref:AraC family transcriptional regulator n=1 Tax=Paenibacillus filicis TaxID=669464 RepID=A0ABU9DNS5_9BACL